MSSNRRALKREAKRGVQDKPAKAAAHSIYEEEKNQF